MEILHNIVLDDKNVDCVEKLYRKNGWTAYAKNIPKLVNAINNSYNITLWDEGCLVALLRAVTDMETIIYVQDILVLPEKQRFGFGTILMKELELKFSNIRQKVLMTDESEKTRKFYESLGYKSCDDGVVVAFMKYAYI